MIKGIDFNEIRLGFEVPAEMLLEAFEDEGYGSGIFYKNEKGFNVLELHTGGWSNCEEMIREIENSFWWHCYWKQSTRGGHYIFESLTRAE